MEMEKETINIPDNILSKIKPCWKCGSLPVITKVTDKYGLRYYSHFEIECPNHDCHNFYMLSDYHNMITDEDLEKWNKLNVEKFVPKSEIKEADNCHKCKHYNACIYTREQHISEYCTGHICDDFEKNLIKGN